MKVQPIGMVLVFACCLAQQALVDARAQETIREMPPTPASQSNGSAAPAKSGVVDGAWSQTPTEGALSPALTGDRRPLYRLRKSDVLAISFTFSPEFNQTVSVQPDGYIELRGVSQLYAERLTVPELVDAIRDRYMTMLNEPEVAVALQDFAKAYFTASGEVGRPGKYELRDDITLNEALAIAGGFTGQAKHSQIVLFRKVSDNLVESRVVDVKAMLKSRKLGEDIHLRSGDFVWVPKNAISKIRQYLPTSSLSMYTTPQQF